MLSLEDVGRAFGNFRLGPLSLAVAEGEYWTLLGPSGAGKSLLLHILAGLHTPAEGRVCLRGVDATRAPPERRGVGLVFQHSALFPHLSVRGNLEYGLRVSRLPAVEREQRCSMLIETLGLMPLLDHPVPTLSGGEAQRVALARALAIRPSLLLLDEPLGPIDEHGRSALLDELRRVHREFGLTTLHVTHSREEARAVSDHCAVMFDGRIVQSGETAQVFEQPRCAFVADFLGVGAPAGPACRRSCAERDDSCPGGRVASQTASGGHSNRGIMS